MNNSPDKAEPLRSSGWFGELLRSGFFWITLALMTHALVAQWIGGFGWKVVAWGLLGAHLFCYVGMCLMIMAIVGPAFDLIKPNKQITDHGHD